MAEAMPQVMKGDIGDLHAVSCLSMPISFQFTVSWAHFACMMRQVSLANLLILAQL